MDVVCDRRKKDGVEERTKFPSRREIPSGVVRVVTHSPKELSFLEGILGSGSH